MLCLSGFKPYYIFKIYFIKIEMFFIVYNVHFYPLFYDCIKAIYYNYYNNNIYKI